MHFLSQQRAISVPRTPNELGRRDVRQASPFSAPDLSARDQR
jgi:hypothetical protein